MADYVLPGVVEKRVRFFDGQFLQDQDFVDEQNYQRDREHRHNRLLHGPGVAEGLAVTSATANQVTVAPGTAIDADGNQLALAQPTTLDLPGAEFNDKQGVQIYLSFQATATDQQTVGGSSDYTRWLERPQLTALAPGNAYSGTASPVLLASVAVDHAGRVTVDNTARTYSGLRLPGPGADAATLRATGSGQLDLAGGLTVDGNLGVGTASPGAKLQVVGGGGGSIDFVVNGRMQSNNNDGGLWVTSDRFVGGYGSGQLGFWNNGDWRLTVLNNGNVGIGTHNPGARLEVDGGGGQSVDLVVNGRLRSNNNDGGLWVAGDRFVGGFDTNKIGFYNSGQWWLAVTNDGNIGVSYTKPTYPLHIGPGKALRIEAGTSPADNAAYFSFGGNGAFSIDGPGVPGGRLMVDNSGNVGIGNPKPGAKLHVVGGGSMSVDFVVNGRLRSDNNDGGLWVASDRFIGGLDVNKVGFFNAGWRLAVLNNGNVGIGTNNPGARLEVDGGGGGSIDFVVNGRMQSNNNDGGLWVASDRFVGGFGTSNIGFWNGNDWRLYVMNNGQVVTKNDLFVSGRLVYADGGNQWWHLHPQQALFFGGGGGWWAANDTVGGPSDLRLKSDVRPVTDALSLVSKLRAVRYRWGERGLSHFTKDIATSVSAGPDATDEQHEQVRETERGKALDALSGDRLGLIAQDVEAVLPELVRDDADGYKHVRYQHLTALLVAAINEQDAVVRALSAEVAALRSSVGATEGARSLCGSRWNSASAS
ncbi:MAG TPA: tail fiber domain-containing protein [Streptosporangiaceae bacterium]|nr:tail fiber domain-containing protein [Streptosporangiaceae bacterium]